MRPSAHRRSAHRTPRHGPAPPAMVQPPSRRPCAGLLATPLSRVLLALLLLFAIWLPPVFLADGTDPRVLVVNAVLTPTSLLVLTSRRRRRPGGSPRQDSRRVG